MSHIRRSFGTASRLRNEVSLSSSMFEGAKSKPLRPSSSDLFLGTYQFELELNEGHSRWRVDRSFEVEIEKGQTPHGAPESRKIAEITCSR